MEGLNIKPNSGYKKNFRKLWKETFNDSDDYLDLVFNGSFNSELSVSAEVDHRLVSMITGVPYDFESGNHALKGLYLCGVATLKSQRGHGLISRLLNEIEQKAYENGFAFTFLIPASPELRLFYGKRGYFNAFYNVESRYTSVHDFMGEYDSLFNQRNGNQSEIEEIIDSVNVGKLDFRNPDEISMVADYVNLIEKSENDYLVLVHSHEDMLRVIKENEISGGGIYIAKNARGEICGCAFATRDGFDAVRIQHMYSNDKLVSLKILSKIKKDYPDKGMVLVQYPEESDRRFIWSETFRSHGTDVVDNGIYQIAEREFDIRYHSKPFGMAKIVDYNQIINYLSSKDNIHFRKILPMVQFMGKTELSRILFRKIDNSRLVLESIGVPRLALNMSLLLE